MNIKIKDRTGQPVKSSGNESKAVSFLYNNPVGRGVLKVLVMPFWSKVAGAYMDSRVSKIHIKKMSKKINVDYSRLEKTDFSSFNDFFTRRIKPEFRPIDDNKNAFISPADSKLTVYDINGDSEFPIKGSYYSVADLLGGDKKKAEEFAEGVCLIFRLAVDDYHRYCYVDQGTKGENIFIKGVLHTVQPIALKNYNIYKQNSREYTILKTENFGNIAQVEIGAMMVGRIKNLHGPCSFQKGQEKGMFVFGGSTIVLLVKKGVLKIDEDILINSEDNVETVVKMGEKIGIKTS